MAVVRNTGAAEAGLADKPGQGNNVLAAGEEQQALPNRDEDHRVPDRGHANRDHRRVRGRVHPNLDHRDHRVRGVVLGQKPC